MSGSSNSLRQAVALLLSTAWRADRSRTLGAMLIYPIGVIALPLLGVALKFITDALLAQDRAGALTGAAILVGVLCGLYVLELLAWEYCIDLEDSVGFAVEKEIATLSAGIPGIGHLERPDFHDRLHILDEQGWQLGRAMYVLPMNWGTLLRAIVTFALLAMLDPLLLLLPLFAIPVVLAARSREKLRRAAVDAAAEDQRRARHLFELGTQAGPAKEIRVNNLPDRLLAWHRAAWSHAAALLERAAWRGAARDAAAWLIFAVGFVLATGWIAWLAQQGLRTPGDVVLALTLAGQVSLNVNSVVGTVTELQRVAHLAGHVIWFRDHARQAAAPVATASAPPPSALTRGITFDRVSFSYPGTAAPVLRDVTLTLPAGAVVALVGENGSGKTTLVKLLCRFYEPTAGGIFVDGQSLSACSLNAWRERVTATYQDFARLQFTALESVGVGDWPAMNETRVRSAFTRAGVDAPDRWLPQGLSTQLGQTPAPGLELSSGQWQKVALARGLMRESPLLLVLDEPGANLDPLAEHRLFKRQAAAAGAAARRNGAITLLITHLFSTVRMADLIVVLDRGTVLETGTHAELMRRGGHYARMYELHARGYRAPATA